VSCVKRPLLGVGGTYVESLEEKIMDRGTEAFYMFWRWGPTGASG
jgi:hypothetical protein